MKKPHPGVLVELEVMKVYPVSLGRRGSGLLFGVRWISHSAITAGSDNRGERRGEMRSSS